MMGCRACINTKWTSSRLNNEVHENWGLYAGSKKMDILGVPRNMEMDEFGERIRVGDEIDLFEDELKRFQGRMIRLSDIKETLDRHSEPCQYNVGEIGVSVYEDAHVIDMADFRSESRDRQGFDPDRDRFGK